MYVFLLYICTLNIYIYIYIYILYIYINEFEICEKDMGACLAGFGYTKAGQQFLQVIRTGVTMVVSGTSHNLALTKTGTVLAWGANDHGQVRAAALKDTSW